jgi:hypothetical protein
VVVVVGAVVVAHLAHGLVLLVAQLTVELLHIHIHMPVSHTYMPESAIHRHSQTTDIKNRGTSTWLSLPRHLNKHPLTQQDTITWRHTDLVHVLDLLLERLLLRVLLLLTPWPPSQYSLTTSTPIQHASLAYHALLLELLRLLHLNVQQLAVPCGLPGILVILLQTPITRQSDAIAPNPELHNHTKHIQRGLTS